MEELEIKLVESLLAELRALKHDTEEILLHLRNRDHAPNVTAKIRNILSGSIAMRPRGRGEAARLRPGPAVQQYLQDEEVWP